MKSNERCLYRGKLFIDGRDHMCASCPAALYLECCLVSNISILAPLIFTLDPRHWRHRAGEIPVYSMKTLLLTVDLSQVILVTHQASVRLR